MFIPSMCLYVETVTPHGSRGWCAHDHARICNDQMSYVKQTCVSRQGDTYSYTKVYIILERASCNFRTRDMCAEYLLDHTETTVENARSVFQYNNWLSSQCLHFQDTFNEKTTFGCFIAPPLLEPHN